jgi:DNA repair protein RadC
MDKKVPEYMMPKYRLYHEGPEHLSDPELMSIVIGTGTNEERALYASNDIFKTFGLNNIGSASVTELTGIPGITKLKASIISAVFELSRRHACSGGKDEKQRIHSPEIAFEHIYPMVRDERVEHFIVLLLDIKNHLLKTVRVSKGSLNANIVHPREVFRPAILEGAASIIVAHNHPSGDPGPSQNDIDITRKLKETGVICGIELYDHLIIGDNRFLSMKEQGLMS